jgi:hypothetical protein
MTSCASRHRAMTTHPRPGDPIWGESTARLPRASAGGGLIVAGEGVRPLWWDRDGSAAATNPAARPLAPAVATASVPRRSDARSAVPRRHDRMDAVRRFRLALVTISLVVLIAAGLIVWRRGGRPTGGTTRESGSAGQSEAPAGRALPEQTTLPPPVLSASEKPVILIYREAGFNPNVPPYEVISAVWGDGRIVWRANGGLLQSHIDVKKIDELLQRLHCEGVFGNGTAGYMKTGPDSANDVVEMALPDRTLRLVSWHELFEKNPGIVVTAQAIEALNGRDRSAVLAAQPPEYLRFRRIWSDIRSTVESWIPPAGSPFEGEIPVGR